MAAFLSIARAGVRDTVDRAFQVYDARCRTGEMSLVECWDALGKSHSVSTLAKLVKVDLERRFGLGQRPRAAEYFKLFPELTESSDRAVSLVYEEFCLLQEFNGNPDSEEFCEVYHDWRDSLYSQLVYHRELSRAVGLDTPSVKFPAPGEQFDKYRLGPILGNGGVARVYLATEEGLGGRRVAIKVSASFGQEPSILAKLDHRNIVPILTGAKSESGLHGICMPYRPGVTLEDLIKRIGRGTPPRSARAIWESLRPSDTTEVLPADKFRTGWAEFPINSSYSEAVAWIGLALGNALSYLHGEGVFHRDIKPANVLLAYREGPQLLDFNLAQDPTSLEQVHVALKGGTLPYMAPEQLKAFLDPTAWEDVGAAADIYSLGLVLRELVTGQCPMAATTSGSPHRGISGLLEQRLSEPVDIREINPNVPPTFVAIIQKCLAVDPADRYASATALTEDLLCFLARQPLVHAVNPSKVERAVNFIHRFRPRLLVAASLLLIFFAGLAVPSASVGTRVQRSEYLLDTGRQQDLEKARVIYEELLQEYPESAWPALYLGLVLEKRGDDRSTKRARELFRQACLRPDAEQALRGRLATDKNSSELLTNLGLVLSHNNKDLDDARKALRRSVDLNPNHFYGLVALAGFEREVDKDLESAFVHFSKADRVPRPRDIAPEDLYGIHKAMLGVQMKLAVKAIDAAPSDRAKATDYLDCFEKTLAALERDWESMPQSERDKTIKGDTHPARVQFFEGCLASCRGALLPKDADEATAAKLFDGAEAHFDQAIKLAIAGSNSYPAWVESVRKQLAASRSRRLNRRELGDRTASVSIVP